jgi:WD40 repeat protein
MTPAGTDLRVVPTPCAADSPSALAQDGSFACGTGRDIWVSRDRDVHELHGHYDGIRGLAFLADGRLASTSLDNTLRVWERDDQRSNAYTIDDAAIPISGGRDTVITEGKRVRVWDLRVGQSWTFPVEATRAAPLEDDRVFAVTTSTGLYRFADPLPPAGPELARWVHAAVEVTE